MVNPICIQPTIDVAQTLCFAIAFRTEFFSQACLHRLSLCSARSADMPGRHVPRHCAYWRLMGS